MDPTRVDDDRDATYTFYGMQPLVFDGTHYTVSLAGWLYDMEMIFQICHIEAYLQVPLASRCLAREARLWWMTLGERAMQGDSWAEFRALIIAHYGPLPNEDADLPYHDPEIYNDMYLGQYLGYAADWRAYPNESMGHYCRRFQDAMLPYIPRDLGDLELQALYLLREGLPSEIRIFVPAPMAGMTVEHMINNIMEAEIIAHILQVDAFVDDIIQVPVDDAGIPEPLFEGDFMAAPEDQPEHPPVIIIDSDDDEEDTEEEVEEQWEKQEQGVWEKEIEDFDDGDWDVDSDASSVVTIEQID
ncbi:hypothetical protein TIFTF001_036406 [Ficus carica]|uniref:Retrotransposon gag domain-containing protein n=1 Tax=Ficus carica TaxID=3494 RepID=A0AA88E4B1_FICCA|nr:hypothetical protein TIFTF001_036406 [Ficus carica]